MKTTIRMGLLLACLGSIAGCAVGEEMGWHRNRAAPTETQLASCDAGTATLKGQPDHDEAHRGCVDAKVRQGLTD